MNKQLYLTDDQIEGIREIVDNLTKKGINGTLKGFAIKNAVEPLHNNKYLQNPYMSTEQAWTTAVVSHLISAGYEIKKKLNEG